MTTKTFSGPKLELWMKGKKVGYGTDFTITVSYNNIRVDTFDDIDSLEIETTGRTVQISLGKVFLSRADLRELGIVPRGVGTVEQKIAQVVDADPIQCIARNKISGETEARVEGCRIGSENYQLNARSLTTVNASWEAISAFFGDDA